MSLIYFVLCSYSITQILVYGKIFDRVRPSHHFFSCPMCVGFWVGLFLWAINGYTELFTYDYSFVSGFIMACISSGTSYIINMVFTDYGISHFRRGE
jgi:uncharacterized membrane protein YvlD (DUF360 family)